MLLLNDHNLPVCVRKQYQKEDDLKREINIICAFTNTGKDRRHAMIAEITTNIQPSPLRYGFG